MYDHCMQLHMPIYALVPLLENRMLHVFAWLGNKVYPRIVHYELSEKPCENYQVSAYASLNLMFPGYCLIWMITVILMEVWFHI